MSTNPIDVAVDYMRRQGIEPDPVRVEEMRAACSALVPAPVIPYVVIRLKTPDYPADEPEQDPANGE